MTVSVSLTVNGESVSADVEPRTLLVQMLREHLGLTGTHVGCDTSQCGACVVHVNGDSLKACTLLAIQAEGADVTTIEGVADGDTLHPMQQAFHENHGLQCGFCTPGMIMSALDLVKNNPRSFREGNPRVAGRQSVPLYRLPQYCEIHRRRRRRDARLTAARSYRPSRPQGGKTWIDLEWI